MSATGNPGEQDDLSHLEADVLEHGAGYDFDQLVRLLAGRLGPEGQGGPAALRVRPTLSMELPRAEVADVARRDDHYEIVTTFLGLYGVSSPLPAFYTEEIVEAVQEDRAGAKVLLDVIHQHLFELYIAARQSRRALDAAVERAEAGFRDALRALVGLRDERARGRLAEPDRMLRYVPLLGSQRRSAEGLRTLLADALGGMPVAVDQCVERRVRIPETSRVRLGGQSYALGEDMVIGSHVGDATGRFRVRIGPLDEDAFHALVNHRSHWEWLVAVIRLYVSTPTQCELEILLEPGAGATTVLGDEHLGRLGGTTWLFSGTPQGLQATLQME
jgi:type VI secretion system protein ImpH